MSLGLNSLLHIFSAESLTVLSCDNFSIWISAENSFHPSAFSKIRIVDLVDWGDARGSWCIPVEQLADFILDDVVDAVRRSEVQVRR